METVLTVQTDPEIDTPPPGLPTTIPTVAGKATATATATATAPALDTLALPVTVDPLREASNDLETTAMLGGRRETTRDASEYITRISTATPLVDRAFPTTTLIARQIAPRTAATTVVIVPETGVGKETERGKGKGTAIGILIRGLG